MDAFDVEVCALRLPGSPTSGGLPLALCILGALVEGDTVAIEFAPHSRMVLQVHRLSQSRGSALTAGESNPVTTD